MFLWSHLEYYEPVNTVQVMPSKSINLLNFSSPETKAQGEQLQSLTVRRRRRLSTISLNSFSS